MQRPLLIAAVVIVAALAAVLWLRRPATSDPAGGPVRSAQESVAADAPPLDAPATPSSSGNRVEVATAPPADVESATGMAWTGVRVQVTAKEDGTPIAGVRVRAGVPGTRYSTEDVDGSHGALNENPLTGADGVVELELAPGSKYTISAQPENDSMGPGSIAVDPPLAEHEVRVLAIALPTRPDLVLHGRVIDRETNAPIPDARVGRSASWNKIVPEDNQRTDNDGRFQVVGNSWRRAVVNVLASGYEIACVRLVQGHTTAETALEITLSRAASVRLTVFDAAGAPLGGLRATLVTAQYRFGRPDGMALVDAGWTDDAEFAAKTDARGGAVLMDLPPRMPLEGVLYRGREELLRVSEPITLSPGESRAIVWRLGSGCSIHGIALEIDGQPVAGLPICLESARMPQSIYFEPVSSEPRRLATTDEAGRFEFADVGPGDWWVGPAPKKIERTKSVQKDEVAPRAQLVQVAGDMRRVDVELRVHRGLTIEGRVLDPTGKPPRYSHITFTRSAEKLWGAENMNDAEGRFILGPLEAGEYELTAGSHASFVSSEPVIARAGDTDVVLRLRAGGKLQGLVVDKASGTPTAASLVIRAHTPVDWAVSLPIANDKGIFQLDGLSAGLYDVAASTSSGLIGVVRAVEVAAGATRDVRVEVEPGSRVRLRYEGPWPFVGVSLLLGDAPAYANGIGKGTESVLVSPAGSVVLRLRNHAEQLDFDLPLTLKVGETRDVVFDGSWK